MRDVLTNMLRGESLGAVAAAIVAAAGGALYDPSVMSSLFQDAAGATPVTATGQPVRLMRDLSGNGFHAIAPSDAARPVLTIASGLSYLAPDAVDDWMNVTPTLNLGETWWHVGGWRSQSSGRRAFGMSNAGATAALNHAATPAWSWRDAANTAYVNATTSSPNAVHVLTIEDGANIAMRYNGVQEVAPFAPFDDSASTQGLVLFSASNAAWVTGMMGRFYGGAFAPGSLAAAARTTLEQLMASRAGVTL